MTDERSVLDDLERQSRGYGGGNDMLDMDQTMDMSDVREDMCWEPGQYPFQITTIEYKISKERTHEKTGQIVGNQPYLHLTLTVFAGPSAGETMDDRVMLDGKAKVRFLNLVRACGLLDEETKQFRGRFNDLLNCELWGEVVNREETYKGEKRTRSGIAFTGYSHISKYEIPEEGDPFAEAGVVTKAAPEAPRMAPVSPPAPEVVSRSSEAELEADLMVEELAEESPFVEGQIEEPAPRPVAAAARPAARPVARAAGEKPPF